jgi:hypothetical protein
MQRRTNGNFKFDADLYTLWRSRNGSSDSHNVEYHLEVLWVGCSAMMSGAGLWRRGKGGSAGCDGVSPNMSKFLHEVYK